VLSSGSVLWNRKVGGFPIDWTALKNPVLQYKDWAIKDFYVQENEGTFYVLFSVFFTGEDKYFYF